MNTTWAVVKIRLEKNSGLYRISGGAGLNFLLFLFFQALLLKEEFLFTSLSAVHIIIWFSYIHSHLVWYMFANRGYAMLESFHLNS